MTDRFSSSTKLLLTVREQVSDIDTDQILGVPAEVLAIG